MRRLGFFSSARRPLTRAVIAGALLLLGGCAGSGVLLVSLAHQLTDQESLNAKHLEPATDDTVRLFVAYLDEETGLRGYLLAGQPTFLDPYRQAVYAIPALTDKLRRDLTPVPGGDAALAGVTQAFDGWSSGYAVPQLALVGAGGLARAQQTAETETGKLLFDRIRTATGSLGARIAAARTSYDRRVRSLGSELVDLLAVCLGLLALVVVLATLVLVGKVTVPVEDLAASARSVAAGDTTARFARARRGRIGRLGADAESVRARLAAQETRAERAIEAVSRNTPTVAALVSALAPRVDTVDSVTAAARIDSAEGLLAGDWYDLLDVGQGRLAAVVGDVSGHGPVAAVLALQMRQAIVSALLEGATPAEALAAASHAASGEQFATVFVACLDPAQSRLDYANAGHLAALLRNHDTPGCTPLGPTGPLLSDIVVARWETISHPWPPGSGLLVYTDGVTESRNRSGVQFGLDDLLDAVRSTDADPPASVVARLADALEGFSDGKAADDRTLVYCVSAGQDAPAHPTGAATPTTA